MTEEPEIEMYWGAFGRRMGLYLVWLIASLIFGAAAADHDLPTAVRVIGAVFVAGTAVIWVSVLRRRQARSDEFDRSLITTTMTAGAMWTLTFAPVFLAVITITTPGDSLQETAFKFVCMQAPLAAAYADWTAQLERRRFARPGR